MLSRLMMRFGVPEAQADGGRVACRTRRPRRRSTRGWRKAATACRQLVVDDPFDRAWRRVGLALDRSGFTVVDRDRSTGIYFVRFSDPDAGMTRKDRQKGFLSS